MIHPSLQLIFLFILSFALGFIAAIPLGGSQIEMAKRAITGHIKAARMVVLGSVSSDLIYGAVALYGLAPFMEIPWVLGAFNVLGVIILWVLSALTLRESKKPPEVIFGQSPLKNKRLAYFTGFSLAFSNPPMILTWLIGVALAKRLGLAESFDGTAKFIFLTGGVMGLGSYLLALSSILQRIKRFVPLQSVGRIYYWLGIVLFVLSFFFAYSAYRFLFNSI